MNADVSSVRPTLVRSDGGRAAAGYRGVTRNCVCRSIAIATQMPYESVYDRLIELARLERPRGTRKRSHPRQGVHRATYERLLAEQGFTWTPTMGIGTGCQVHVRAGELPTEGRHVLRLARHLTAWCDGWLWDTFDCSRGGTACVYGYWSAPDA